MLNQADNFQKINDKLFQILKAKDPIKMAKIMEYGSSDIDGQFLGFVDTYYYLAKIIPKDWRVIDFGCCYAFQSYYFRNHREYVGVDCSPCPKWSFDNTTHINATISGYIEPRIANKFDFNYKTFAISNYVPSGQVEQIRAQFQNLYVFYPQS